MELYEAVFKRKSMRKFDEKLKISDEEMNLIQSKLKSLKKLTPETEVEFVIKPRRETNCRINAEYCILAYTQDKPLWKENIGYMLEQLDLYLATVNIGSCWYGLGKTKEQELNGKLYAIMFCFGKSTSNDFRKDENEFDRKKVEDIWQGLKNDNIANAVRLAPSACNSQPWKVKNDGKEISVYQRQKTDNVLTRALSKYFNGFDMGIFLYILELALDKHGYLYERQLFDNEETELTLLAKYAVLNL